MLTGVWAWPNAACAAPTPTNTASTASRLSATRRLRQNRCCWVAQPNRWLKRSARNATACGKGRCAARARRHSTSSANGPRCDSYNRTASMDHNWVKVKEVESWDADMIDLWRCPAINAAVPADYRVGCPRIRQSEGCIAVTAGQFAR